jgi:hypothetical protein
MTALRSITLGLVALVTTVAPALAFNIDDPIPVEISILKGDDGKYEFRSDFGHEFYTYDKDGKNKSACDDACAEIWAPVKARDGAKNMGEWSLIDRGKGYMQWAFQGKPVYMSVPQVVSNEDPKLHNDGHWHVLVP